MPASDLHDDLCAAYKRFLGRRTRRRRVASLSAFGAIAAIAAVVVTIGVVNGSGTTAHAEGPGSDEYIKCLNDHGWPVGDGLSIDPNGTAPEPGKIDSAVAGCADLEHGILDALRPSDEAFAQLAAQADRFASCMREHGADIGTPNVFRSRVGIGVTFPGWDPGAPGFDDAYAACKSIMS